MKTRLTVVIELDQTPDQLRKDVHDVDASHAGEADAIFIDNVKASDIVAFMMIGDLGYEHTIVTDTIEEM